MKRVLRLMQNHGLTLERHTARRPDRTHDGVIIALHSNIRWCSDHLELHARNREVVRILFVLDACDREIIAWSAVANAGISGEMVRDLMSPPSSAADAPSGFDLGEVSEPQD